VLFRFVEPDIEKVPIDSFKFYSYNDFISNLTSDISGGGGPGPGRSTPGITNLMNGRYSYLMGLSDFLATEPTISDIKTSTDSPIVGEKMVITANVIDEDDVVLRYRTQIRAPFSKVIMYDDGQHNDGAADDNVYGAEIAIESAITEYYIYAENSTIGKFSPTNAEHEFYSIKSAVETAEGDIVINEFLASNDFTIADQDGDYDDWVEVYNKGIEAIDLEGYTLTDDITDFTLFTFPAGTMIQPNDYIIVWADKDTDQDGYHADLKLSASGESLYLTNAELAIIDSVNFGAQETDISYGRYPNGTGDFRAMTPSPSAENIGTVSSVNEWGLEYKLNIYPNPAKEQINISYEKGISSIVILDLNGKALLSNNNLAPQIVQNISIDYLQTGTYFIRINDNVYVQFVKE
jgi:hypothetical protein